MRLLFHQVSSAGAAVLGVSLLLHPVLIVTQVISITTTTTNDGSLRPWVSVDASGSARTIVPEVVTTTISPSGDGQESTSAITNTISTPPAHLTAPAVQNLTITDPANGAVSTSTITAVGPPPTASATGVSGPAGAFLACSSPVAAGGGNSSAAPICQPEQGAVLTPGVTYYVTWDPQSFTNTTISVQVEVDFSNGTSAASSGPLDPGAGFWIWSIPARLFPQQPQQQEQQQQGANATAQIFLSYRQDGDGDGDVQHREDGPTITISTGGAGVSPSPEDMTAVAVAIAVPAMALIAVLVWLCHKHAAALVSLLPSARARRWAERTRERRRQREAGRDDEEDDDHSGDSSGGTTIVMEEEGEGGRGRSRYAAGPGDDTAAAATGDLEDQEMRFRANFKEPVWGAVVIPVGDDDHDDVNDDNLDLESIPSCASSAYFSPPCGASVGSTGARDTYTTAAAGRQSSGSSAASTSPPAAGAAAKMPGRLSPPAPPTQAHLQAQAPSSPRAPAIAVFPDLDRRGRRLFDEEDEPWQRRRRQGRRREEEGGSGYEMV